MNASTIGASTYELRQGTTLVPSTITYDGLNKTARLQPTSPLTPNTVYTATIRGGTTDPRVKDAAGNALAANLVWSFTTATAAPRQRRQRRTDPRGRQPEQPVRPLPERNRPHRRVQRVHGGGHLERHRARC